MTQTLSLIHLEHAFPILSQVDLFRFYGLVYRGIAVIESQKGQPASVILESLGSDYITDIVTLGGQVAGVKALRKLAAISSATVPELLAAERDETKMAELEARAAELPPMEALGCIAFFIGRSSKPDIDVPGSSPTNPDDYLIPKTSGSSDVS